MSKRLISIITAVCMILTLSPLQSVFADCNIIVEEIVPIPIEDEAPEDVPEDEDVPEEDEDAQSEESEDESAASEDESAESEESAVPEDESGESDDDTPSEEPTEEPTEQASLQDFDTSTAGDFSLTYTDGGSYSCTSNGGHFVLDITSGGEYTVTMMSGVTSTGDRIVVSSSEDVTIKLDGVQISSDVAAPFEITGSGDVTVELSGTNVLTSTARNYAGLQKTTTDNLLTINGGGSLTATGGTHAAGIGGGANGYGSNITINSGVITATGGGNAAGIGGGNYSRGTDITINNGIVTATGTDYGAGIGGGCYSHGMNIEINGGFVTATAGEDAAGIGGGAQGVGSDISITGGYITIYTDSGDPIGCGVKSIIGSSNLSVTGGYFASGVAGTAGIGKAYGIYVEEGYAVYKNQDGYSSSYPYVVTAPELSVTTDVEGGYYTDDYGVIDITKGGEYTISMSGISWVSIIQKLRVSSSEDVTVTLDDVLISSVAVSPFEITGSGDVTVQLSGANTLTAVADYNAGLQKTSTDNTLTITGSGSLTATGGKYGAGIGGGSNGYGSNITISDGTIIATGGESGAGIGGGITASGENIIISGGTVTATSSLGAGIGGGEGLDGNGITISGGTVTANGGRLGAGIGGGYYGIGDNITISGGTVTAIGGSDVIVGAAGIGGGFQASGSNITISGGTVTAIGGEGDSEYGDGGAGIGGGGDNNCRGTCSNITISGGTVTATGGNGGGAAIGGGDAGNSSDITISGGYITLSYGTNGTYIGAGNGGSSSNMSVTGGYFADANATPASADGTGYVYGVSAGDTHIVYPNEDESTKDAYPYVVIYRDPNVASFVVETDVENGYTYANRVLTIKSAGEYTISMNTSHAVTSTSNSRIVVSASGAVTITLDSVNITSTVSPFELKGSGDVTIKLKGTNSLTATGCDYAALQKDNTGNTLTITSASGDGSTDGILTAKSADKTAYSSAAIGGAKEHDGMNIVINGGTITAIGSGYAAGIGGGKEGKGQYITINGGNVTATGGPNAAGIGGGWGRYGRDIVINGGTVTATGGSDGAGIGSGAGGGYGGYIRINGGTVTAHAGNNGAAIGGGTRSNGTDIYIYGGYITLTKGSEGAYMGGGYQGNTVVATIYGGYFADTTTSEGWCGYIYGTAVYGTIKANTDPSTSAAYPYMVVSAHSESQASTSTEAPTEAPTAEPTNEPSVPTSGTASTGVTTSRTSSGTSAVTSKVAVTTPAPTAAAATATAEPTSVLPFTDVSIGDWFYNDVLEVYNSGIMDGVSADTFAPESDLTRAVLVTALAKSAGADVSGYSGTTFDDVDAASAYAPYIAWAAANGIVDGYEDNTFRPNESITRAQAAKIIMNYQTYLGDGAEGAWAIRLDYSDTASIDDWAVEGIMYCTMNGIMQGHTDGAFKPLDNIKRSEGAAVLNRLK